jgi:uncharacterized lipoprotein YddW (UPF0748 family)
VSLTAALLLAALAVQPPAGPVPDVRGLWVVRTALVSPASVDRVVDEAAAGGLNTLYVQVRGRGDAFYESRVVARSPLLFGQPLSFDPLQRLLERARSRGLAVHAWVNVMIASHFQPVPPDNVVALHPEWLMVPRRAERARLPADRQGLAWLVRQVSRGNPDVEGFFLSPSSPGVGQHLEAVVRELVGRYAVDGLHFDFIRYPSADYDYSVAALQGFAKENGNDPLRGPVAQPAAWAAYRRDVLTNLAARLARVARETRPGLRLSAAVVPDQATALHQKFQNWPEWMQIGLLDAVCPMTYTPDPRIFRQQLVEARAKVQASQGLYAGVPAYRLSLAEVAERIAVARQVGANGYVLFSHESFAPGDLSRLRSAR